MNQRIAMFGAGGALIALFLLANALFIVDERQRALVLQFGRVVGEPIETPGLRVKIPFIQNVAFFENRIMPLETTQLEVTPLDDRRLVVDAFARWRIVDTIRFRQAVFDEAAAVPRLQSILNAALREVLGSAPSSALLSEERVSLMNRIRDRADFSARELGVDVVDVRIRRADLPEQNLAATFARMQAEREREAADERARGAEAAQRVRANADRMAVELVSEARRESEIIRGEADAQRNAIFAEAFGQDPEFFTFLRSLRAYETALNGDNSSIVMGPDSAFFDYLRTPQRVSER
ncbi:MAG: protease modulator HflC [Rhodobacteraceae bacterium]|nr:MAG: protease modulator HflC [Paracoccaceae bacterium]